jgi:hypothetical protein
MEAILNPYKKITPPEALPKVRCTGEMEGRGLLEFGRDFYPNLVQKFFHFFQIQYQLILLVGASRFERPTPCAQGRCAIQAALRPDMLFITIID